MLSLQILSLGAGFDSLYFRLKDMGLLHRTVVYEVDFPNVACQKATLIKRMKELSALVGDTGGEGLGMAFMKDFFCTKCLEEVNIALAFKKWDIIVGGLWNCRWKACSFNEKCWNIICKHWEITRSQDGFVRSWLYQTKVSFFLLQILKQCVQLWAHWSKNSGKL